MEKRQKAQGRGKMRSIRHQKVDFEEMVPPASVGKHLGWFVNGVGAAVAPVAGLFRVGASFRFWSSLVVFICIMVLPVVGALHMLTAYDVHVNEDIKMVLVYSCMLSVSLPVCYVWQHSIFVMGYEAKNNIRGAGQYDFATYVKSGKCTMVLTDCMLLYLVVLLCSAINRVRVLGHLGVAVVVVLEALVMCFICYSSRLERMSIHTRGLKCQYIETHLPFFLGFSVPSVLFVMWASAHFPLVYSPVITTLVIAFATLGSSAVRSDDIGQPHKQPYILTAAHHVVSFAFPTASGRGIV